VAEIQSIGTQPVASRCNLDAVSWALALFAKTFELAISKPSLIVFLYGLDAEVTRALLAANPIFRPRTHRKKVSLDE
jgi:hypothetical protein